MLCLILQSRFATGQKIQVRALTCLVEEEIQTIMVNQEAEELIWPLLHPKSAGPLDCELL